MRRAALLLGVMAAAALSARVAADDTRAFLDDAALGIVWKLPSSRWTGKGAAGADGQDRLATAQRDADGMTLEASVHRLVLPKRDPREGRIDPLERARELCGTTAGNQPRLDLGRHDVLKREGQRAAFAVGEYKESDPPARNLAVVLVREADYVWLEASGAAKLLDDATIQELIDSIQVRGDPAPKK